MKDTVFNGQKNNFYYHTSPPYHLKVVEGGRAHIKSNRFNLHMLLSSTHLRILDNYIPFGPRLTGHVLEQNTYYGRMYYHISNIRAINRIGPHNEDVISVIIGSILGDAYCNKRSGEGVRICYRQSIIHRDYLFWLYNFLYNRGYTSNLQPRQYTRIIRSKEGKVYYGYEFNTFTFRSFSWIHNIFYINGKKVIPKNISEYLTPLALAVWIMDDGGWTNSGVRISTNNFELKEVELLNDVLKSKYNLETTIQKIWIKDQYSIYIKKQSVPNLRNIIGPFIHTSMLYKLGIDNID